MTDPGRGGDLPQRRRALPMPPDDRIVPGQGRLGPQAIPALNQRRSSNHLISSRHGPNCTLGERYIDSMPSRRFYRNVRRVDLGYNISRGNWAGIVRNGARRNAYRSGHRWLGRLIGRVR